jgi:hypothetical protein
MRADGPRRTPLTHAQLLQVPVQQGAAGSQRHSHAGARPAL